MGTGEVMPQNPTDPNWGLPASNGPTDPNWGASPPYQPRNILEEGRRSALPGRNPDIQDEESAGFLSWLKEPFAVAKLIDYLKPMAKPETLNDLAGLLIPDAGLAASVRAGGRATAATGRIAEAVGTSPVAQHMGTVGAIGEMARGDLKGAAVSYLAPRGVTAAGRGLQRAGAAIENAATTQAAAPHMLTAGAPQLPAIADASFVRGVPADLAEVTPMASHAPITAVFNLNTVLQAARDAFTAARETPRAAELSNTMELIRRGKSPEEALAVVLRNRPTAAVSPAEAFAQRFGLPTEAERIAAQDARYTAGKVKTPSAETARRSRP